MGGWRGPHETKEAQGSIRRDHLSFCLSYLTFAKNYTSVHSVV